jgi:hypothetical protein
MEPTPDLTLDAIVVDMDLELPDLQALQHYVHRRAAEQRTLLSRWITTLVGIGIVAAAAFLAVHLLDHAAHILSVFVGIVAGGVSIVLAVRVGSMFSRPSRSSP